MAKKNKYALVGNEFISPKNMELPLTLKVKGADAYVVSYSHYVDKTLGYQDCTVKFENRSKKQGTCVHCDAGVKSRIKFTWDADIMKDGEWKTVLLRMNSTSHNELVGTVAALKITGHIIPDTPLDLRITRHTKTTKEPWEYDYYVFQLSDANVPPPSKQSEPKKSPFATKVIAPTPSEIVEQEEESGTLNKIDKEILAEHGKLIFEQKWTVGDLKTAFNMTLSEEKNIHDEQHALDVAEYVIANFEDLKKEYLK